MLIAGPARFVLYAVVLATTAWVVWAFYLVVCHAVCRCGNGTVSRGDGYQYIGNWLEDLPHGQGIRSIA